MEVVVQYAWNDHSKIAQPNRSQMSTFMNFDKMFQYISHNIVTWKYCEPDVGHAVNCVIGFKWGDLTFMFIIIFM
jgi:hypothetical protein